MILLGLVAGYLFITVEAEQHFILLVIGIILSSQIMAALTDIGKPLGAVLTSAGTYLAVMVVALVARNIVAWVSPQK